MRHNVARLAMLLAMLGIDLPPMPDPPKEPSKPAPRRAWALLGARRDRVAWAARMTALVMSPRGGR